MKDDFQVWKDLMKVETRCEMAIVSLSGIVEEIDFTAFLISSAGVPVGTGSMKYASSLLGGIKRELESLSNNARKERVKRQERMFDALEDNE
ncbi:Uncharacterised protein [Corynebacterium minutissimum]|uniref:Uncharacterized protein n=3 Tax=Corynebacterium minutissimum TaxID=38301 RepID=A0A376CYJ0_9CORY|nr:Uncharacterised protein [Corynebacterium minutissimum]